MEKLLRLATMGITEFLNYKTFIKVITAFNCQDEITLDEKSYNIDI